jgi:mycoredoxin
MTTPATDPSTEVEEAAAVTVYWRPGCLFCAALLRGLARDGIEVRAVDIWQDPDAAAVVRSLTGGDETVPTVIVDDVALINPSTADVRRQLDPSATPGVVERLRRAWSTSRGGRRP